MMRYEPQGGLSENSSLVTCSNVFGFASIGGGFQVKGVQ